LQDLYDGVTPELELIRAPYSFTKMAVRDAGPVQVAERLAGGVLEYEIRVPLRPDSAGAFALGIGAPDPRSSAGATLGVGLEVPATRHRGTPPPRSASVPSSGDAGFDAPSDDGTRGTDGPGGGQMRGPSGSIELWMKVRLAGR
jgi:hypothetical protein